MFAPCTPAFIQRLAESLPPGALREVAPADLVEPRGRWKGAAGAVARPATPEELSIILAACNAARVPVVTRGGGTGLVGGNVIPAETGLMPLVVSLERMRALRGIWPDGNAITVEAGMTLAEVQAAAEAEGRLFPLSLAAEGTATIGGNLGTNAGGTQVLRYGTARELCLGVEAVLADGRVMRGLKRLRKDNTGYDLRDLMIGSEGTLGIITAASLRLYPRPAHRVVAMMVVASPREAQKLLRLAEARLGGLINGFELISGVGFGFLEEGRLDLRAPFAQTPQWSVLIELGLPQAMDPEVAMASLYAEADELGLVQDGVIAASEAQADHLWHLRESIPEGNRRVGAISSHDISLPLGAIPDFIESTAAALSAIAPVRINCFGHLGDGNLHFNSFPPRGMSREDFAEHRAALSRAVHDAVDAHDGSISAEHGIGRLKAGDLARYGDPTRLALMASIKAALDPNGILNPGAVLQQLG